MRRGDVSKERAAVHDEREPMAPIADLRGVAVGHVENDDRTLRLVTEGSIGWGWDGKGA
jgi:hypothetical protein